VKIKISLPSRIEKAILKIEQKLELIMSIVTDLLEATKANTDATNATILLMHGLVDQVAALNAAGDVEGVAAALVEIKANTASLISATTENTPHADVVPTPAEVQAAVDAVNAAVIDPTAVE